MEKRGHILLDTYAKHTILGKGSYGYVYGPMFPCGNDPDYDELEVDEREKIVKNLVSKLCELDEGQKEYQLGKLVISEIEIKDPTIIKGDFKSYKYGVYAQSHCAMVTKSDSKSSTRFLNAKKGNFELDDLITNLTRKEKNLDRIREIKNGTRIAVLQMEKADGCISSINFEKAEFKNLSLESRFQWFHGIDNVIIGLLKMHLKNLHHFDVKPENLVYFGPKTHPTTIKMCDFGLVLRTNQVNKDNCFAVYYFHDNWPPLTKLLYDLILLKKRTKNIIKNAIHTWVEGYKVFFREKAKNLIQRMNFVYKKLLDEEYCLGVVYRFLRKSRASEIRLKNLLDAADMYGIALTLSRMWSFFDDREKDDQIKFVSFLSKCIEFDFTDQEFYLKFHELKELFTGGALPIPDPERPKNPNPSIWMNKTRTEPAFRTEPVTPLLEEESAPEINPPSPISRFLATSDVRQFLCGI